MKSQEILSPLPLQIGLFLGTELQGCGEHFSRDLQVYTEVCIVPYNPELRGGRAVTGYPYVSLV